MARKRSQAPPEWDIQNPERSRILSEGRRYRRPLPEPPDGSGSAVIRREDAVPCTGAHAGCPSRLIRESREAHARIHAARYSEPIRRAGGPLRSSDPCAYVAEAGRGIAEICERDSQELPGGAGDKCHS